MATKRILTDETGQDMVNVLALIAQGSIEEITDMTRLHNIVRSGLASKFFQIGDQLIVPWSDGTTTYQVPMDIVHFGNVDLEDGTSVPGMYLQWHYCTPFGVQFDQNEAFYHCDQELPAGTYNITMGNSWGSNVVAGKTYQFTLASPVPAGGQLQIGTQTSEMSNLPDKAPANWRIRTYQSATNTTPIEIVQMTEGNAGTSLGTLSSSTKYADSGINNMQRAGYGYNRWSQSGMRKYLNSVGSNWWTPSNVFDRPPAEATKAGFKSGFNSDFLAILKPIKVRTALNTISDIDIGSYEDTYDMFFLASKRNENLQEQLANVEGDIWDYWYQLTKGVKPADHVAGAAPITYAIENHASPQNVRLRSALRGYAYSTWSVYSSGHVSNSYAVYALRFSPACVIC